MNATQTRPLVHLDAVKVFSNTEIAPSVFVLSFRRSFSFRAGQVIGIGLSPDDDPRLYSIASGEEDETIQILYNIKPGGHLTPSLASVKTGDQIWITPPFGSYQGTSEPACWIAAGTGLAPFFSMYRTGMGENKILIHGGRTLDSFYFSNELASAFGNRYVRCCSQEDSPEVFHGRVTQYLQELNSLPSEMKYYLCGSAEMVVECREILLAKGVPFNQIVAEIYF